MYNSTLKGKINGLEETVKALAEEINFYASELSGLKDEKITLEENLAKKTSEIRQALQSDVVQATGDMKTSYQNQKSENQRMQA